MMILAWERPVTLRWRLSVWASLALMVAALIWAVFAEIKVYAVVRGTLEPRGQTVMVAAPVAGRVLEMNTSRFAQVQAGQVLFVLDAVGVDATTSRLQIEGQKAQLTEARSAVAQAQGELEQRARQVERIKPLTAIGAASLNEYETAVEATSKAKQALEQAQARLQGLEAQLGQLERRERITITSPATGQVTQLAVRHVGDIASLAAPLVEIMPKGVPLVFNASARGADRPKLRQGAKVEIAWDGYPSQKFGISHGQVMSIAPTGVRSDDGSNRPESRDPNYQLEINLNALSLKSAEGTHPLLVGLAGEARVLSAQKRAIELFWDWLRGVTP